jgi:hypothetical protein
MELLLVAVGQEDACVVYRRGEVLDEIAENGEISFDFIPGFDHLSVGLWVWEGYPTMVRTKFEGFETHDYSAGKWRKADATEISCFLVGCSPWSRMGGRHGADMPRKNFG